MPATPAPKRQQLSELFALQPAERREAAFSLALEVAEVKALLPTKGTEAGAAATELGLLLHVLVAQNQYNGNRDDRELEVPKRVHRVAWSRVNRHEELHDLDLVTILRDESEEIALLVALVNGPTPHRRPVPPPDDRGHWCQRHRITAPNLPSLTHVERHHRDWLAWDRQALQAEPEAPHRGQAKRPLCGALGEAEIHFALLPVLHVEDPDSAILVGRYDTRRLLAVDDRRCNTTFELWALNMPHLHLLQVYKAPLRTSLEEQVAELAFKGLDASPGDGGGVDLPAHRSVFGEDADLTLGVPRHEILV
mmetsp:Transcript_134075/g.286680  ORF Transcript_134075/g.286680 Transcript_134075/m.286680 type:complete len:308 (-) Transcript_134075:951-1874(-)